ncbi:MAG: Zn-binding domain-containing protein, partial [Myxococcota bacterium]
MDWRSVHTMLHEQAIYQHAGEQFQVERLDYENHKGFVRRVEPDYYTTAMTHTKVTVLEEEQNEGMASSGEVSVVEKVVGYKKIKFHTHENVGYGDVHLPEVQMHTTAFWLTVPEALVRSLPAPRPAVLDGLRAIGHAMHTVAALGLMVDPRDLGKTLTDRKGSGFVPGGGADPGLGTETQRDAELFDPSLFFYDAIPGGIGLAPRLFDEREMLLRRTRALVEGCVCGEGCPACIGPAVGAPDAPEVRPGERKALARRILAELGAAPTH